MSMACHEAGFTPLTEDENEDDESIIVGCLRGVCVEVVGSKEQYSLDFTIINLPRHTSLASIQLGKRLVDVVIRSNSLSSHMPKDDEGEDDDYPYEGDPKATEPTHQDTSDRDFAFEYFFEDQLAETSLEKDMRDEEYDHESSSPLKSSKLGFKGDFPTMAPKPEEPLDPEGEEQMAQEIQEHEYTTSMCLKDRKFTNCMVSSRMDFNVMT